MLDFYRTGRTHHLEKAISVFHNKEAAHKQLTLTLTLVSKSENIQPLQIYDMTLFHKQLHYHQVSTWRMGQWELPHRAKE